MKQIAGPLSKMMVDLAEPVNYLLPVGDQSIAMNPLVGSEIHLRFDHHIACTNCGKKTKKSYSQGFCYPCSQKLAKCDLCIMKPETCHFDQGTCREPEWGKTHCFQPHYVYLSNTSGLKVGITREENLYSRWIDQGAIQAIPIFKVSHRKLAGNMEVILKKHVADKTNWRKMLKQDPARLDLQQEKDQLLSLARADIEVLKGHYETNEVLELLDNARTIEYPMLQDCEKLSSINLDKNPEFTGKLIGIKGQYLLFETAVINIRKYTSYHVSIAW